MTASNYQMKVNSPLYLSFLSFNCIKSRSTLFFSPAALRSAPEMKRPVLAERSHNNISELHREEMVQTTKLQWCYCNLNVDSYFTSMKDYKHSNCALSTNIKSQNRWFWQGGTLKIDISMNDFRKYHRPHTSSERDVISLMHRILDDWTEISYPYELAEGMQAHCWSQKSNGSTPIQTGE